VTAKTVAPLKGTPDISTARLIHSYRAGLSLGQWIRELTVNAIESIGRAGGTGVVRWDVTQRKGSIAPNDPLSGKPLIAPKLFLVDTGDGMTRDQLVSFLTRIGWSTGNTEPGGPNFGVGARISLLHLCPYGALYRTLRAGEKEGHEALGRLTLSNELELLAGADGQHVRTIPLSEFPDEIRDAGHGTVVYLLGESAEHDTTRVWGDINNDDYPNKINGSRFVLQYLNTRFISFPPTIKVQAPKCKKDGSFDTMATAQGADYYTRAASAWNGIVKVRGAEIHCFIPRKHPSKHITPGDYDDLPRIDFVLDNEVYTTHRKVAERRPRFEDLRLSISASYLILRVHLDRKDGYQVPPSRAFVYRGDARGSNRGFPWDAWVADFKANMPKELRDFEAQLAEDQLKHTSSKKAMQREFVEVYGDVLLPTVQPSTKPSSKGIPGSVPVTGGPGHGGGNGGGNGIGNGTLSGGKYSPGSPMKKPATVKPQKTTDFDLPKVVWEEKGAFERRFGDINLPADYDPNNHVLTMNLGSLFYREFSAKWRSRINSEDPAHVRRVRSFVRKEYALAFVEGVMSAIALKADKTFRKKDKWKILFSQDAMFAYANVRLRREKRVRAFMAKKHLLKAQSAWPTAENFLNTRKLLKAPKATAPAIPAFTTPPPTAPTTP